MNNTIIRQIKARQLIDCKCRPMLEVDVITEEGIMGRGSAPTGSSVGYHEAFIMRDHDPSEYGGLSVHKAVDIIHKIIAPALIGMDVTDQKLLDQRMIELDGTPNKSVLGGNSIYSTSVACLRAAAACQDLPVYLYLAGGKIETLPLPTFNVINGGHYQGYSQAFNEFILAPYRADSVEEAVEIGVKVFHQLGKTVERFLGGSSAGVGGSYGYIAPSDDPEVVLNLLAEAVDTCSYNDKVAFALDCASNEMYDSNTNTYLLKGKKVTSDELIDYVEGLTRKFNLIFVEDLLQENDWDGYSKATRQLKRTNIIGDDFIATSVERLKKAYAQNALHGFVFKPNQIGTISESLATFEFAKQNEVITIPSGRAGGVLGDVVADFAIGMQVQIMKNGAPRSGERIDKLNSLLRVSNIHPETKLADVSSIVRF